MLWLVSLPCSKQHQQMFSLSQSPTQAHRRILLQYVETSTRIPTTKGLGKQHGQGAFVSTWYSNIWRGIYTNAIEVSSWQFCWCPDFSRMGVLVTCWCCLTSRGPLLPPGASHWQSYTWQRMGVLRLPSEWCGPLGSNSTCTRWDQTSLCGQCSPVPLCNAGMR